MTHRYLRLTYVNFNNCQKNIALLDFSNLVQFEQENCYINNFIKCETLKHDVCTLIEKERSLTKDERALILSPEKTNASKRPLTLKDYYDDECLNLIGERDKLIIDKFGYTQPTNQ